MDNLSREELLEILKNQNASIPTKPTKSTQNLSTASSISTFLGGHSMSNSQTANTQKMSCEFAPSKPKNAPKCTEIATTPYGFCQKHSRTVQALKAKQLYEELIAKEKENTSKDDNTTLNQDGTGSLPEPNISTFKEVSNIEGKSKKKVTFSDVVEEIKPKEQSLNTKTRSTRSAKKDESIEDKTVIASTKSLPKKIQTKSKKGNNIESLSDGGSSDDTIEENGSKKRGKNRGLSKESSKKKDLSSDYFEETNSSETLSKEESINDKRNTKKTLSQKEQPQSKSSLSKNIDQQSQKQSSKQSEQTSQKSSSKQPEQSHKGKEVTPTITKVIKKNYWGRYEDVDTKIVFDPIRKCAFGIQEPTGRVAQLKQSDIDICKKYGWNYVSPKDEPSESESTDEDDESSESVRDSDFDTDASENSNLSDDDTSSDDSDDSYNSNSFEDEDDSDEDSDEDDSDIDTLDSDDYEEDSDEYDSEDSDNEDSENSDDSDY